MNREQVRESRRMAGSSDIVIPKQAGKLLYQASEIVQRELSKQRIQWNAFVKPGILSIFHTADLHSSFFVNRDNLRKRSNISFDDRLFMKAPNNIELRMPVALRKLDAGVEIFDPYGSMKVAIEEEPEYELAEDSLYIMRMKKQFPMYPLCPVLDKKRNGLEMHLQPIPLSLYAEPEADSDFAYLAEQPDYIRNENEAADIITYLQNYYRLRDYLVERKDATTIIVNAEKKFIISYSQNRYCLKLGIFY